MTNVPTLFYLFQYKTVHGIIIPFGYMAFALACSGQDMYINISTCGIFFRLLFVHLDKEINTGGGNDINSTMADVLFQSRVKS